MSVEATRRRIVEATMALHAEQGITATRWEDIARRSGVGLATVYRHFPSLDELVPACGELTNEVLAPPTRAEAAAMYPAGMPLAQRLDLLVTTWCRFYDRGGEVVAGVRREAHLVGALQAWIDELDEARRAHVRAALAEAATPENLRVGMALTQEGLWASLGSAEAPEVIRTLLARWIDRAPPPGG